MRITLQPSAALMAVLLSVPVAAGTQTVDPDQASTIQQPQNLAQTNIAGHVGDSTVGRVGQRQTRETAERATGIKPTARLASRIPNRVQNRIRSRIDRDYDPTANATNPFAVAEEQARNSDRGR